VQAELRAKTGSPNLGPTHMPQNLVQPPPIQRAILNRHHARRSNSSIAPKLEPGIISPLPPIHGHSSATSPKSRPTPSSHSASPAATTSYGSQHGASPTSSDHLSVSIRPPMSTSTSMKAPPNPHALSNMPGQRQMQMAALQQGAAHARGVVPGTSAPFYATPSFQNHIEQLGKLPRLFSPPSPFDRTVPVLGLFREYRTGVRCSRRHYGGSGRPSRYPRARPLPWSVIYRRTADDVPPLARDDWFFWWSADRRTVPHGRCRSHTAPGIPIDDPAA